MVLDFGTIVAENTNPVRDFAVVGNYCSTVTKGTQVFPGIKAKSSSITKASNPFTFIFCPMGLGRVLYDF